jgi:hypothetical protein
VTRAYALAWGRPANPEEVARAVEYVRRYQLGLGETGPAADRCEREAWTSFARVMLTANEFLYVD